MKKIEILAPAGSMESLKAAINASCDAVYIGGSKFGARAYADNPQGDSLLEAIDFAHLHDKQIYLTVNTLLKNSEIENELYEYLEKYYLEGLDAVIVQDVGVLRFVHEHFPRLDIHASTQMTLTMANGLEAMKDMGVTRLVNSRELSLEEIKRIRENTDLEIESFVHGALCYCYSGQCLMSSMIGGRSGNRGRCAQPCRMPYQVLADNKNLLSERDKYILSPKDICTIDMVPDLIEAGITSFKIEGRMKRPEYAAGVSHTYKKYVELYLELGREKYDNYIRNHKVEFDQDLMNLQDLYNRGGFSKGYYNTKNGSAMMSIQRPNHSGVYVGTVKAVKNNQVQIALEENINAQDILEIRENTAVDKGKKKENKNFETNKFDTNKLNNKKFGNKKFENSKSLQSDNYKSLKIDNPKSNFDSIYEFTVKAGEKKGGIYQVNINRGLFVEPGSPVFRTKNNKLLENIQDEFLKEEAKMPMTGELTVEVGQPLKLTLSCRNCNTEVFGDIVEEAKSQPMTEDKIRKQINKTNETAFYFEELRVHIDGTPFIPLQKLNELRRNGIDALIEALIDSPRRCPEILKESIFNQRNESKESNSDFDSIGVHVSIETKEQLKPVCEAKEVTDIYLDYDIVPLSQLVELSTYIKNKGKRCFIILPQIFRATTYEYFKKYKSILEDNTINGYIIRNLEEYEFVKNVCDYRKLQKEIILDYNLYVMNREAFKFWNELGVDKFTAPVELNYSELKEMKGLYHDFIVYGRIPVMVSAQCILKTASGGTNKYYCKDNASPCVSPDVRKIELVDRYQKHFEVKRHCRECYNTIYNSQSLSLLNNKEEVLNIEPANIRLNFTFESSEETEKIVKAFIEQYLYDEPQKEVVNDYTRGHFKRGVE